MKFYGDVPRTLRDFAVKHPDVIEEVGCEGEDGYWVYFRPGWVDEESGLHQIHEYTVVEVKCRFRLVKKEGGELNG